ncbi:uncharacterized protein LOC106177971 [Lingula anatina]|uniref:Uncharacterized protein LOC106177971 n=1 Tax=Lingula anatina TaxID=7574 RepID=A0A1S3K172_LINAN|nr:uncharacterized protein LOC106177971 [Lingula anatina]|eukprot:XP_013416383.1 uncharacterized protein LOC106177971 [Lingula anatina]
MAHRQSHSIKLQFPATGNFKYNYVRERLSAIYRETHISKLRDILPWTESEFIEVIVLGENADQLATQMQSGGFDRVDVLKSEQDVSRDVPRLYIFASKMIPAKEDVQLLQGILNQAEHEVCSVVSVAFTTSAFSQEECPMAKQDIVEKILQKASPYLPTEVLNSISDDILYWNNEIDITEKVFFYLMEAVEKVMTEFMEIVRKMIASLEKNLVKSKNNRESIFQSDSDDDNERPNTKDLEKLKLLQLEMNKLSSKVKMYRNPHDSSLRETPVISESVKVELHKRSYIRAFGIMFGKLHIYVNEGTDLEQLGMKNDIERIVSGDEFCKDFCIEKCSKTSKITPYGFGVGSKLFKKPDINSKFGTLGCLAFGDGKVEDVFAVTCEHVARKCKYVELEGGFLPVGTIAYSKPAQWGPLQGGIPPPELILCGMRTDLTLQAILSYTTFPRDIFNINGVQKII